MTRQSADAKAISTLANAFNSLTTNTESMAYALTLVEPVIQKQIFAMLIEYIRMLDHQLQTDSFDASMLNECILAARLMDQLRLYSD